MVEGRNNGRTMTKRLHIDVIKSLPGHVIVGDMVEMLLHTHEGTVIAFIAQQDYERLSRNEFFIAPEQGEQRAGVIATTETFITE